MMKHHLVMVVFAAAALCDPACAARERHDFVHITALGNEGFLIEAGEVVILVDGLYRGLEGYVVPTEVQRRTREKAEPPFDEVDLVLATHRHPDHFDAEVVGKHLVANPGAALITTPMAVDLLQADAGRFSAISPRVWAVYPEEGELELLDFTGFRVEVVNLHHGRNRAFPVENLGFVVHLNGVTLLHIGDTLADATELASLGLAKRGIDTAFVPYWHLLDAPGAREYLEAIRATTVVAMHLPAEDAPPAYFEPASDLESLTAMVEAAVPGVLVFAQVMEERTISVHPEKR